MDITIRNLDERAYRELEARAARSGKTIDETVNEAVRAYLATPEPGRKAGALAALTPLPYPPGNGRLSEEIDSVAYGV